MMNSQSPSQAAKHTATNLGWYAVICLIIAVGYAAYDTNFFTKPLSWWRIGIQQTAPVTDYAK